MTKSRRKAPWPDFKGNPIYEGDVIEHPVSGERGTVVFLKHLPKRDEWRSHHYRWRVIYDMLGPTSLLSVQIGEKAQGAVVDLSKPKLREYQQAAVEKIQKTTEPLIMRSGSSLWPWPPKKDNET